MSAREAAKEIRVVPANRLTELIANPTNTLFRWFGRVPDEPAINVELSEFA